MGCHIISPWARLGRKKRQENDRPLSGAEKPDTQGRSDWARVYHSVSQEVVLLTLTGCSLERSLLASVAIYKTQDATWEKKPFCCFAWGWTSWLWDYVGHTFFCVHPMTVAIEFVPVWDKLTVTRNNPRLCCSTCKSNQGLREELHTLAGEGSWGRGTLNCV